VEASHFIAGFDTRTMPFNGTYGGQGKAAAVTPGAALLCLMEAAAPHEIYAEFLRESRWRAAPFQFSIAMTFVPTIAVGNLVVAVSLQRAMQVVACNDDDADTLADFFARRISANASTSFGFPVAQLKA
jgi:hypothetical protein